MTIKNIDIIKAIQNTGTFPTKSGESSTDDNDLIEGKLNILVTKACGHHADTHMKYQRQRELCNSSKRSRLLKRPRGFDKD